MHNLNGQVRVLFFSAFILATPFLVRSFAGPSVSKKAITIKNHIFQIEIAKSPEEWRKGLMFRQKLAPNEGMLFWGEETEPRSFWMKNTYVSLDILFLDENGKILHIAENATPLSETPIPSTKPARHVLEILGGRSKELGLKEEEDVIQFDFLKTKSKLPSSAKTKP